MGWPPRSFPTNLRKHIQQKHCLFVSRIWRHSATLVCTREGGAELEFWLHKAGRGTSMFHCTEGGVDTHQAHAIVQACRRGGDITILIRGWYLLKAMRLQDRAMHKLKRKSTGTKPHWKLPKQVMMKSANHVMGFPCIWQPSDLGSFYFIAPRIPLGQNSSKALVWGCGLVMFNS